MIKEIKKIFEQILDRLGEIVELLKARKQEKSKIDEVIEGTRPPMSLEETITELEKKPVRN